jgi:hypothetical protein
MAAKVALASVLLSLGAAWAGTDLSEALLLHGCCPAVQKHLCAHNTAEVSVIKLNHKQVAQLQLQQAVSKLLACMLQQQQQQQQQQYTRHAISAFGLQLPCRLKHLSAQNTTLCMIFISCS